MTTVAALYGSEFENHWKSTAHVTVQYSTAVWLGFFESDVTKHRPDQTINYRGSPLSTNSLSTIPGIVQFEIVLKSMDSPI